MYPYISTRKWRHNEQKKAKLEQLQESVRKADAQEAKLQAEVSGLEEGREETDERSEMLAKMNGTEEKLSKVQAELARFAEFDPDEMEKRKQDTEKTREAVNRWVDNIFNLQSWANKTFSMEKKDFDSQFGIPEELDYVE